MNVTICTPMYGGQCTAGYTASMIELFKQAAKCDDFELNFMYGVNEALITRARNLCASIFLKTKDTTHLLFIDADIQFNPADVIKMIRTKKDFICGIYPKKTIKWDRIREAAIQGASVESLPSYGNEYLFIPTNGLDEDKDGLVEIDRAGTGMMMISRTVFDTLSSKVRSFNLEAPITSNVKFEKEDQYKEYFYTSVDPNTNIFLHEDFTFCKMWRDTGGKIYGAPWVKLYHIGTHTFG